MSFDPHSITQKQLHDLRTAAEAAWSDDTRHPDYAGHPHPSIGQCYVTSRWLTTKLGGHVGQKKGHFFWVSPDKQYVIDLSGDSFSHEPEDMRYHGAKLDEDDEGWIPTDEQKTWRAGPVLYKLATHPLYKGFRVREYTDTNPRVKTFCKRADEAYNA